MDLRSLKRIALVGATKNKEKVGNIILRDLTKKGYEVIPVTPKDDEVEGIKTVNKVENLPKDIDSIVFVVPPKIGIEVTKETINSRFKNLWYQPGTYSAEIEKILSKNDIKAIHDICILVETSKVLWWQVKKALIGLKFLISLGNNKLKIKKKNINEIKVFKKFFNITIFPILT